jgi:serine O-acetyltransferase
MKSLDKAYEEVWPSIRAEAERMAKDEPALTALVSAHVLQTRDLNEALSLLLAEKLESPAMGAAQLHALFSEIYAKHPRLERHCRLDILSILRYDPAARDYITPFLFFKGFHALQAWRAAHAFWLDGRRPLALLLQNRMSMVFDVDIHPAAKIGEGVTLDHATGIVIGETAIIGNNVLMLHDVTLGTRGFERGDRHPIIEDDVIIGAGAKILGRITVGRGARVAAGSLVLEAVPADHTVAGVPARVVKTP